MGVTIGTFTPISQGGGGNLFGVSFTPPVNSQYAFTNQGTATVTDLGTAGVLLTCPSNAGDHHRVYTKAQPTVPYSCVGFFVPQLTGANHNRLGYTWRESATGKLVALVMKNFNWQIVKMTDANTFSSEATIANLGWLCNALTGGCWVQMANDGVNLTCWLSANGRTWQRGFQEAIAAFFTVAPDEIGMDGDPNNGNVGVAGLYKHWAEFTAFQGTQIGA